MSEVVIRGGTVLTMDDRFTIATGDVASLNGELVQVGGSYSPSSKDFEVIDATGCVVMPGMIQSHTHMCQTLARGRADDLSLLEWLRNVVWPYEAAMDREDVAAAARLACAELLLGGTTAIQDMGTVHHTDALFEAARDSGLRATIGKVMMDEHTPDIPVRLQESTRASIDESIRLCSDWHGRCDDRLRYAFAPRFVLSCTETLLRETAQEARHRGARLHTHASENQDEIAEVERRSGMRNIHYLHSVGMTGDDVGLAHCVWLDDSEVALLRETGTHVLHCPSSNLKLSSGVAHVPELVSDGVSVSIGADGAPCNNNLDAFLELRLAALIHKPRAGSKALPAAQALRLATVGGAQALGLSKKIGSLEIGKRADVIVVRVDDVHVVPSANPFSSIVYASRSSDVCHVVVDGKLVVRDRRLLTVDVETALIQAQKRAHKLFAGLGQA